MIDTPLTTETLCKSCGRPIAQVGGKGHRKREYCDDVCRQAWHRQEKARKEREAQQEAMRERWSGFLLTTQVVLEDVFNSLSLGNDMAERVAQAIRDEIHQSSLSHNETDLERIAELEREVEIHRQNTETCQQKLADTQARNLTQEKQLEVQKHRLAHYYQLVHNGNTVRQQSQEAPPQVPVTKPRTKPAQGLPEGLVNLLAFAGLHRISQNEVRSRISSGHIHVVRGKWKTEVGWVKEALDREGQHDFWIQFHKHDEFKRCDACPH